MQAESIRVMKLRLSRVLKKDGAFLLEAMIGTAILAIVMVFFATVSVSAFLLMQRAYSETQITEDVFVRIESRKYTDTDPAESLNLSRSSTPISGGSEFVMGSMGMKDSKEVYVSYVTGDGTESGILEEINLTPATSTAKALFRADLYTLRYQKTKEGYTATFYILKGEK